MKLKQLLSETKEFNKLKKCKVPLTPEERAEVMKAKAVWCGPNGEETPAIQVAKFPDGSRKYWCGTHRAWSGSCNTLKQAIKKFEFIKTTA